MMSSFDTHGDLLKDGTTGSAGISIAKLSGYMTHVSQLCLLVTETPVPIAIVK